MPRKKLEKPGEYPFTRGIYPEMYRKKKPTIRQFAGHGTAPDTNERFRKILEFGGSRAGLSVAFDLPTLMGMDSDEEICEGQVGWDGVAIDTLADMEDLFIGIPVDSITVSMTINAPAAAIWAMYLAMAEKRGIPFYKLGGTLQNDILKEYIAQKEWLFPEEIGMKLVVDTIAYAARYASKWHPVSISGYHIREAGSTAMQEIAYTLANGIEYVKKTLERGLEIDEFAPQLSFFFDLHNNFAEEVAKLRAARRLWARIMRDKFGTNNPRSQWLRAHVQTSGVTLTRHNPLVNVARVALQAFAAYCGGAQSVHTNAFDEVLCTPTEEALKVAVLTQQIIQEETGICDFPDLLGGSRKIEQLTDELETAAWEEIGRVEAMGGMMEAIKQSYPQRMIREAAAKQDQKIVSGETTVAEPRNVLEELKKRRGFEESQLLRLRKIKANRGREEVEKALAGVRKAAEAKENMMPSLIQAASSYATLGEICKTMQEVFGTYQETERDFSDFSFDPSLNQTAEKYRLAKPLRILVAKGGLDGHDRIINTLLAFYKKLGAEAIFPGLHMPMRALAKRAVEEDADIIGISTHIGNPAAHFERLREHLRAFGREDITIIGGGIITSDDLKILPSLGVKKFFPTGTSFEEIARFFYEEALLCTNA